MKEPLVWFPVSATLYRYITTWCSSLTCDTIVASWAGCELNCGPSSGQSEEVTLLLLLLRVVAWHLWNACLSGSASDSDWLAVGFCQCEVHKMLPLKLRSADAWNARDTLCARVCVCLWLQRKMAAHTKVSSWEEWWQRNRNVNKYVSGRVSSRFFPPNTSSLLTHDNNKKEGEKKLYHMECDPIWQGYKITWKVSR